MRYTPKRRVPDTKIHVLSWHLALALILTAALLGYRLTTGWLAGGWLAGQGDLLGLGLLAVSLGLLIALFGLWNRSLFSLADLKRLVLQHGGGELVLQQGFRTAKIGELRLFVRLDNPLFDNVPVYLHRLDRALARLLPWLDRRRQSPPAHLTEQGEAHVFSLGCFAGLAGVCIEIDHAGVRTTAEVDPELEHVLHQAGKLWNGEDTVLKVEGTDHWMHVSVRGGTWLGDRFQRRIAKALEITRLLAERLASRLTERGSQCWSIQHGKEGFTARPIVAEEQHDRRVVRRRAVVPQLVAPLLVATLLAAAPAAPQPVDNGVAFLVASQQADGSWSSSLVRREQATTEVLRALQDLGREPVLRGTAADFLELVPVLDDDDRARRLGVLAAEGRDVSGLVAALVDATAPGGGWGLDALFAADPLDTTLAVAPLAAQPGVDSLLIQRALSFLLSTQHDDGGWPCVSSGDSDADSEIFCTSHAVLAFAPFRSQFYLDPEITAAADFLHGWLQGDGSFGPAGANSRLHTALASLALAAVPAFGGEVANVILYLEGQQQADGSWEGDPYVTALALRALQALSAVPFCGDGLINQPGEACDGTNLGGLTCEAVGLGAGTLACSPQCTLDTSGCADPPICGDNLRNQPWEVCDGSDLADESCESLGFASGMLACATDCLSFDVSSCNAEAYCGDGVVNLPGELCDLSDLNGQTCESLGLGGGLLQCAPDCNLDTSLCDAAGFEIDNKGREFFVGFMQNYDGTATAALHLTSDVPTTVTVQYPAVTPSFFQNVAVNPGQVTIVNLPRTAHTGWPLGSVRSNAVRASAPEEFVVYLVNRRVYTSDAGMALPVDALGTSYVITSYIGLIHAELLVVAPFEDTTVTVTPSTSMRLPTGTVSPGVASEITLNRGEGFRAEASYSTGDITGTFIEADRPIFVLNGNVCTNIPRGYAACDHIFEVAHPIRSWGKSALVTNLPNRSNGSIYRAVASQDGTEVLLDGAPQAMLDLGDFLEVGPLTGNHVFSAEQPIFVSQFMTGDGYPGAYLGDPAMANMIPPEQYLEEYTFSTVGGGQFAQHFLTLTAPDSSLGSVLLDGVPLDPAGFTPVAGTGYSSTVVALGEGSHTTTSPEPHGITVEGFNSYDSYIYPGGARLEFINQFCGDGAVNQDNEECDGSDFQGANCSSFGFSSGFLQCTVDCRVDTSQCTGISAEDEDDDGFPASEDCDDTDPEVNPGMEEIPGNGVDDDCNPATPDEIPETALSCTLISLQIAYQPTEPVLLQATVENSDASLSLAGVHASLVVLDGGGTSVFEDLRPLNPLPPGAQSQLSFAFDASGNIAGSYSAQLDLLVSGSALSSCSTVFDIASTATSGAGLTGTLLLDPELVNAGDPSIATYTLENQGNATLADLAIRVLLLDPQTGAIVGELVDTTTLEPGGSFTATGSFSTVGLEINKSYLAVLLATPSGSDEELTLDSATLTVVNAPPDCSDAFADPTVVWPPNHKLTAVAIEGVTDPDGDPVTLSVLGILQDERTDDLGSGDTCPDAGGVGTPSASVRAERSGRQDGRVYHIFFLADDGRGASCEGEVTVCVPHDQRGPRSVCVDQGALYDSMSCP